MTPTSLHTARRLNCWMCAADWPITHKDGTKRVHRPPNQPNGQVAWCESNGIWDAVDGVAGNPVPIYEGSNNDRWAAGARAAADLAQQIANKWKTYDITSKAECAQDIADAIRQFIDMRNEPQPIDWTRPIVWCETGDAAIYVGSWGSWHYLAYQGERGEILVNSTGHDRSGKQIVRQEADLTPTSAATPPATQGE